MNRVDAIVVGAGIAGLACASYLARAGARPLVLEADDRVGGRIRTDRVDGFLLDRGFQVLLTAYPECRDLLDYAELDLRPFEPGSLIRRAGRFQRLADPWRRPRHALASLTAGVGNLADRYRMARMRARVRSQSVDRLLRAPERTTLEALRREGFSEDMIEGFFRPFLGGVFLESALATSSRMVEFVFKCFSEGDTALPAAGMEALPEQLARGLADGVVRTGRRVARIVEGAVELNGGERFEAPAIVLATDAARAVSLVPGLAEPSWRATVCVYFDCPTPPVDEAILILDGDGCGPVNHLCVPSHVSETYAPAGRSLVSANVVGDPAGDDATLERAIRAQLTDWFGKGVRDWRHLRTYRIREALPARAGNRLEPHAVDPAIGPGLFACGDHLDTPSINGALASGRRAARAVLDQA